MCRPTAAAARFVLYLYFCIARPLHVPGSGSIRFTAQPASLLKSLLSATTAGEVAVCISPLARALK